MKLSITTLSLCLMFIAIPAYCYETYPLINFNDLPVNSGAGQLPGSSSAWQWSLNTAGLDMWTNTTAHDGTNDYIQRYSPGYNSDHMGWENFGFLEIDNTVAVKGNALKYNITGGKNTTYLNGIGALVKNKTEYLQTNSSSVVNGIAGTPYIYITNNTVGSDAYHQPLAAARINSNNNRLTFYIKGDSSLTVGAGGYDVAPPTLLQIGTFSGTGLTGGSHYYHYLAISGGNWTKIILGNYPDWNNSGFHPSTQVDNYIPQLFGIYVANEQYAGSAMTPYATWMDEFQFEYDDYTPQNTETINNIAIEYNPSTKVWEIGFRDKYWVTNLSKATYEVRYSFSAITNENWSSATPIQTQANSGFRIEARTDGRFKRNNTSAYAAVWAQFKLATTADENTFLTNGRVYFAIKDVSQNPTNMMAVNPDLTGNLSGNGRDYTNTSFNYDTDSQYLPYINRFYYDLPLNGSEIVSGSCGSSNGLSLPSAPTSSFCSAGTASAVTGTGPWSWTCAGSGGGSTASCGATLATQARSVSIKLGSGGKMTGILR